MLIGIDASRAVMAQRTGTENYSLYLIRALIQEGCSHRFRLYFNQAPPEGLFVRDERVSWRIIPFPRLWTHMRLAWEVTLYPPDVLYVPAHVLPLSHPKRCLATIHDLGYLHYPQAHTRWARWYLDWATRFNVRVSARVIVDSRATAEDLVSFYDVNPAKIVLAYPAGAEGFAPVTDPKALEAVRLKYGIGQHYFLYVGTLQPRKNLTTLIQAFASLIAERAIGDDVRLVLAGKQGWLYKEVLKMAHKSAIQERVIFTGYVAQEDLPALLSGAVAYVLPSWYEGFGLPMLEAMSCNAPVICSKASSLPEVAGEAALLFNPADASALAEAMRRVYVDHGLRQELIARGRERVRAFTWQRCAQQVLAAIEAVGRGE